MNNNTPTTIQAISDFLFLPANPAKVDLLFVFGSRDLNTMDEVAKLYKKEYAKRILITGHSTGKLREVEADRFFKRGVELRIPEEVFLLEREAVNTKENIIFSLPIIEKEIGFANIKTILLVCKAFHTRRVFMTAKKFFPKHVEVLFQPVTDSQGIQKENWWKNDTAKARVLSELERIGKYAQEGDLSLEG